MASEDFAFAPSTPPNNRQEIARFERLHARKAYTKPLFAWHSDVPVALERPLVDLPKRALIALPEFQSKVILQKLADTANTGIVKETPNSLKHLELVNLFDRKSCVTPNAAIPRHHTKVLLPAFTFDPSWKDGRRGTPNDKAQLHVGQGSRQIRQEQRPRHRRTLARHNFSVSIRKRKAEAVEDPNDENVKPSTGSRVDWKTRLV